MNSYGFSLNFLDGVTAPLRAMSSTIQGVENTMNGLRKSTSMFSSLTSKAFAFNQVLDFGRNVAGLVTPFTDVLAKYEKFDAVLTASIGAENAKSVMGDLKVLALTTPYAVDEWTESFVKMNGRGLIPTMDEMRNMGDVAAVLGKDIGQVTEAVLDVNNTERWNEIGIKVVTEGNKIKATYKGITVESEKSEKGALRAIQELSQKAPGVAGMMQKISGTTGGQISNMQDAFEQLQLSVAEAFKPLITFVLPKISAGLGFISNLFKQYSPQIEGFLNVIGTAFQGIYNFIAPIFAPLQRLFTGVFNVALRNFERLKTVISDNLPGLTRIRDVWIKIGDFLTSILVPALDILSAVFFKVVDFGIKLLVEWYDGWIALGNGIFNIFNGIGNFFSGLFDKLFGFIDNIFPNFTAAFQKTKDWLWNVFIKPIADWFGSLFKFDFGLSSPVSEERKKTDYEKINKEYGIAGKANNKTNLGIGKGSEVKGSGSSIKNFNITIQKQIEGGITIHTTTLEGALSKVKDAVSAVLADAVNDVNYSTN